MEVSDQSERKTTYIGNVQIRSSQKPRKPCTSITYHVDSWTKRGHIRHYKSGKTVYIPEKVCHRRKAETTKPTNATIENENKMTEAKKFIRNWKCGKKEYTFKKEYVHF